MIVKVKPTPTEAMTATKLQLYGCGKLVVSETKNSFCELNHVLTSCHDKSGGTPINTQNTEILPRKSFCFNIPQAGI